MTNQFQPGAMVYTQSFGSRPENVEVPFIANRAPTARDINYPIGKRWLFKGDSEWVLISQSTSQGIVSSNWAQLGSGSGSVSTVSGTANQITSTTVEDDVTLSIPASFVAPGSIEATTFLSVNGGAVTDYIGTATLVAGTVTIANTNITADDRIFITRNSLNASPALGTLIYTITPGVGFTVDSYTDAGVAQITDVSGFSYLIVKQS